MKSRIGKIVSRDGEEYLTCQEVITYLLDFLAHELDRQEEAAFSRHLALCPSCVAYLETYQIAVRLGRETMLRAEAASAGSSLPEDLLSQVLAARGRAGAPDLGE